MYLFLFHHFSAGTGSGITDVVKSKTLSAPVRHHECHRTVGDQTQNFDTVIDAVPDHRAGLQRYTEQAK